MAQEFLNNIAQVYAQAIFELAQKQDCLQIIHDEILLLGQLAKENKDFNLFLQTPSITPEKKLKSINNIFKNQLSDLTLDFLAVLNKRLRLDILKDIALAFKNLNDEFNQRAEGTLVTAIPLSDELFLQITQQISQMLGKNIKLHPQVNPDIIGGMILTVGDTLIDTSVRQSLKHFAQQLRRQRDQQLINFSEKMIQDS